jgi:hypothetical protein
MFENTDFLLSYSRADAIWDAVLVDFLPRRHFGLPLPSCFDQCLSALRNRITEACLRLADLTGCEAHADCKRKDPPP